MEETACLPERKSFSVILQADWELGAFAASDD